MKINFDKFPDQLAPAIVQDATTNKVLMLGYMNCEALEKTLAEGRITFYSRSKKRLWTKGETSGNFLTVEEIRADCDSDALLIKALPEGAICHTGADTCFAEENRADDFLYKLEKIIRERKRAPKPDSYVSKLFAAGINRIAQKVGEEAVETIIEAKDSNEDALKTEVADLLFHLFVLLAACNVKLKDISDILAARRK